MTNTQGQLIVKAVRAILFGALAVIFLSSCGESTSNPDIRKPPEPKKEAPAYLAKSFLGELKEKNFEINKLSKEDEEIVSELCNRLYKAPPSEWPAIRRDIQKYGFVAERSYIIILFQRLDKDLERIRAEFKDKDRKEFMISLHQSIWPQVETELVAIGDNAVPMILMAIQKARQRFMVEEFGGALLLMGEGAMTQLLVLFRDSDDFRTRMYCMDILSQSLEPIAAKTLELVLNQDPDPDLRARAGIGLGAMDLSDNLEILRKAYDKETNPEVRLRCVEGLKRFSSADPVAFLLRALEDESSAVRKASALCLAFRKDPRAVEATILCMEKALARRGGEAAEEASTCYYALRRSTQEDFKYDIGKWKNWWKQEGPKKLRDQFLLRNIGMLGQIPDLLKYWRESRQAGDGAECRRIQTVLEEMTGLNQGSNPEDWQKWWDSEGKAFWEENKEG